MNRFFTPMTNSMPAACSAASFACPFFGSENMEHSAVYSLGTIAMVPIFVFLRSSMIRITISILANILRPLILLADSTPLPKEHPNLV